MKDSSQYQIIFSEILLNFSKVYHSKFGEIYIKHLSYLESGALETQYNIYLSEATKNGVPTFKQRESQVLLEGNWTSKNEAELTSYQTMINNMRSNYSKDFLNSRRKQLKKNIQDNLLELDKLVIKKNFYIGNTAESYANKKITYYRIIHSFFKDSECKIKLIDETIEDLDDKDYLELIELYNKNQDRLGGDNIKKIALSPFFTSLFSLCPDNAYNFYGKPAINLTNYQVILYITGANFRNILSQYGNTLTDDIKSNPDELLDTIEMRQNARDAKIIDDNDDKGGSMSIPGASALDLQKLGIQVTKGNKMQEALKKSGGILTKEQLIELGE